jgi:tRNA dimethylallyltransferase
VDPKVRRQVRELVACEGAEAAHGLLAMEDPEMARRLRPEDSQRVSRALEVVRSSGRSLASWQEAVEPGPLTAADASGLVAKLVLMPPRDWLYSRCDRRFDAMLAAGAMEEVRALPPHDPGLPAMKALGIPQLRAALDGEMDMAAAVERAKTATRQYAKRQMTWFRNQCADWEWVGEKQTESISEEAFSKIIKRGLTA